MIDCLSNALRIQWFKDSKLKPVTHLHCQTQQMWQRSCECEWQIIAVKKTFFNDFPNEIILPSERSRLWRRLGKQLERHDELNLKHVAVVCSDSLTSNQPTIRSK